MKIPCRPGKIAQAPTNRMNFIKDDSYNILASLTATFRYTCNGNYSKTEFHDFLHPSPSRFSLLKVLKSDKLIRFTPCYYVSRAKRFSECKIAGKRAPQISLLRVRHTSKRRSKCECRTDSCITQ